MPSIAGISYMVLLFLAAFLGTLVCLVPATPFMLLYNPIYSSWNSFIKSRFFSFSAVLIRVLLGIKLRLHGDTWDGVGNNLVISNHRTRLDWMFLWLYFGHHGLLRTLKIVLKWPLKHVPGFGWGCQYFEFLFLRRKWEADKAHVAQYLDQAPGHGAFNLLLFPEGTDLSEKNKALSHKFADKMKLVKYEYVLHPRVTGFTYMTSKLQENKGCQGLLDLTLAYEGNMPASEAMFLNGRFPAAIHVHAKRYSLSELPKEPAALDKWCQERFATKEAQLAAFYNSSNNNNTNNNAASSLWASPREVNLPLVDSVASVLFQLVLITGVFYGLWAWAWLRWYCTIASLALIVVSRVGGVDVLQLQAGGSAAARSHAKTS